MAKKKYNFNIGNLALIIGLIIAVIVAFVDISAVISGAILAILGILVGLLNIESKEGKNFAFGVVVLILIAFLVVGTGTVGSAAGLLNIGAGIGIIIERILNGVMALVIPAAITVTLREILKMAYK